MPQNLKRRISWPAPRAIGNQDDCQTIRSFEIFAKDQKRCVSSLSFYLFRLCDALHLKYGIDGFVPFRSVGLILATDDVYGRGRRLYRSTKLSGRHLKMRRCRPASPFGMTFQPQRCRRCATVLAREFVGGHVARPSDPTQFYQLLGCHLFILK